MTEISTPSSGQESEGQSIYASLEVGTELTPESKATASELAVEQVLLEDAARIVATVANNEAKALTFVAMALRGGGARLNYGQIYSLFLGMQGSEQPAWPEIGHRVPGQYATSTFEPIGAVAKSSEATSRGFVDRFAVTAYGQRVGLAVTGLMLDLALEYPETSQYEIFGITSSKGPEQRRSPFTRLQLLQALLSRPGSPMSINNIAHEMEVEPSLISGQVTSLEKTGILAVERFERSASDKSIAIINQTDFDSVVLHPNKSDVPSLMHSYLSSQNTLGNETLIEDLIESVAYLHPEISSKAIRDSVHETIAKWERDGLLATSSNFSQEQRSFVRIAPDKFEMIEELMIRVKGIMEGDQSFLDWGEQRAAEILSDAQKVNLLLARAKEASPFKHRELTPDFKIRVISLLQEGEATAEALADRIAAAGKPTSQNSVRRILNILADSNEVTYRVKSGKRHYKLTDK